MTTKHERERSGRRILAVAIGVSAAVHVVALLFISFRVDPMESPDREFVIVPAADAQVVALNDVPPPPPIQAQAASAADAGAGAAIAPRSTAPSSEPSVAAAPLDQGALVAALDSLLSVSATPITQVATALGQNAAEPSSATQTAGTANTNRHVPGSAARAKSGGSAAGDGVGASSGKGGITIKFGGPKRHGPKRHPPRGIPGRRF